jgi:hypothetical protein
MLFQRSHSTVQYRNVQVKVSVVPHSVDIITLVGCKHKQLLFAPFAQRFNFLGLMEHLFGILDLLVCKNLNLPLSYGELVLECCLKCS